MILDKLNFFYFMLSFAFGLFICYITNPQPEIILKFPSPTNAGKVTYKDKAGECYSYKAEKRYQILIISTSRLPLLSIYFSLDV